LFEEIVGRRPGVTRDPDTGAVTGKFVALIAASVAVAGIRAQHGEIGNAARGAVEANKSRKK
jgi:hypothetical protein